MNRNQGRQDRKLALNNEPAQGFDSLITLNEKSKKDPLGQFLHSWLGMRDSNPRMVGPEPTALPLGESPVHKTFYQNHLLFSSPMLQHKYK